ncbi:hypothetical protein Hanom_Chr01g00083451 [Helianthus anomalus]
MFNTSLIKTSLAQFEKTTMAMKVNIYTEKHVNSTSACIDDSYRTSHKCMNHHSPECRH